ncbi:hypothetical protein SAMN02746041_02464 [Desulfacinum hydrothermale DSM 13146]|uniref:PH domain-containing protein n=1 Tax=Desulfacinum hydrothermale DSM 13146 TaxID=1121390 RepID=A0A1W1XPW5_9BACT|nr:hypothetical protein SAMN02746041_02464 [Desulfacinum hydrothermale DSM 13146]
MQLYRHRQVGTLILVALGFGVVLTAMLLILVPEGRVLTGLVLVILLLCILLFHALTVEVSTDELVVSFGPGVIRKRFRIADIHDARVAKNRWYYGWGIRLTPHGWLFNVSGLNAVELELKNNRKFRIGTDDPQRLITSIQTARQLTSQ